MLKVVNRLTEQACSCVKLVNGKGIRLIEDPRALEWWKW